jgi:hypothetical protein
MAKRRFTKYPSNYVRASKLASELSTAEDILDKLCDGFQSAWETLEDYGDAESAYFELKDYLKTTSLTPDQLEHAENLCDAVIYGIQDVWESLESDSAFWDAQNELRDYLRKTLR